VALVTNYSHSNEVTKILLTNYSCPQQNTRNPKERQNIKAN